MRIPTQGLVSVDTTADLVRLGLVLAVLVALAAAVSRVAGLGYSRAQVTAALRATLQLALVGSVIAAVLDSWWLTAGFAALMLAAPDGRQRIVVFILVTVFSDIGGYAVGVKFGKHPMAPSLSPKKSWEGFAGSVLSCALVGAISLPLLLDGVWWAGAVLGVVAAAAATLGDLIESSIKRDLGIKDMSTILPGHGGLMDRLDSLVVVAPVAWALLLLFVPVA